MTKSTATDTITEQLHNKLIDLYFVQTRRYLVQFKNSKYTTLHSGRLSSKGNKIYHVNRWHINNHLQGKSTLGALGGKYKNKLICFDVDFPNDKMAKWITYKISRTLTTYGIEKHYISFSGNKGYHIDIFFEDLIFLDNAKKFYDFILLEAGVNEHCNGSGKVEFRISDKQGLKIPLGYHQETNSFCGFCLPEDGLEIMSQQESYTYFLSIDKHKESDVLEILELYSNSGVSRNEGFQTSKKDSLRLEDALSHYNDLSMYNPTEDDQIDKAIELYNNGLKYIGSRHNATLLIAKYMLYCGVERDECEQQLLAWMDEQDPKTYSTKIEECYADIHTIVRDTYDKQYQIKVKPREVTVTYNEMLYILQHCTHNSQIVLAYAFLVHGRFFCRKDGVFYLAYSVMARATGLSEKTCRNQVEHLNQIGVIEFVSRNQKQADTHIKKANRYRLTLDINNQDMAQMQVQLKTDVRDVLGNLFGDKELKREIGRKRYQSLIS